MAKVASIMKLFPGKEAEYKKRHDEIWPELATLLSETGISDYSIFLDEKTLNLFAVFEVADATALDTLPEQPVMRKWWHYMSDIMDTNADESPVSIPLKQVFYLP